MKLFKKKLGILLVFSIISKANIAQQQVIDKDNSRQIVYQFNSYSIEKDKLLQQEFKDNGQLKISYSCIPAGIVVIESSNTLSDDDIKLIKQKANRIDATYTLVNHLTLKEVESKCATYRSN
jgi:hypothetical protein